MVQLRAHWWCHLGGLCGWEGGVTAPWVQCSRVWDKVQNKEAATARSTEVLRWICKRNVNERDGRQKGV
eukprot:352891-Chlamydomonas_euryale.AAC.4